MVLAFPVDFRTGSVHREDLGEGLKVGGPDSRPLVDNRYYSGIN